MNTSTRAVPGRTAAEEPDLSIVKHPSLAFKPNTGNLGFFSRAARAERFCQKMQHAILDVVEDWRQFSRERKDRR